MFAMSELFTYLGDGRSPTTAEVDLAAEIARRYLDSLCVRWQGDSSRLEFEQWLGGFWTWEMPSRPDRPADAVSPHGGGGRGIDWFDTGAAVAGYIAGVTGGYLIPRAAIS